MISALIIGLTLSSCVSNEKRVQLIDGDKPFRIAESVLEDEKGNLHQVGQENPMWAISEAELYRLETADSPKLDWKIRAQFYVLLVILIFSILTYRKRF